MEKPKKILGIRKSAIVETLVFLIAVTALGYSIGNNDRFFNIEPHPFWIIVLLITVQYGTNEALFCAFASSLFLLAGNIPAQQFDENIFDHILEIARYPLMWFSAAVILGQLSSRQIQRKEEFREDYEKTQEREKTITNAYSKLKEIKEMLETKLAGQLRSTASAYSSIKSIETLNPSRVLLGVEEVVKATLNPEKFSIYALGPGGFEPATCVGWNDNEIFSRRFDTKSKLYQAIIGNKRLLCAVNKDDADILADEGVLAAPLIDMESGAIFGMLKIEQLDFMELNISNIETFRTMCEWIGTAYTNAQKYHEAQENSIITAENGIFSYNFLCTYQNLRAKLYPNLKEALITIKTTYEKGVTKENIQPVFAEIIKTVKEFLPSGQAIFNGKRTGYELIVVLPPEQGKAAESAIEELEKKIKKNPAIKEIIFEIIE